MFFILWVKCIELALQKEWIIMRQAYVEIFSHYKIHDIFVLTSLWSFFHDFIFVYAFHLLFQCSNSFILLYLLSCMALLNDKLSMIQAMKNSGPVPYVESDVVQSNMQCIPLFLVVNNIFVNQLQSSDIGTGISVIERKSNIKARYWWPFFRSPLIGSFSNKLVIRVWYESVI